MVGEQVQTGRELVLDGWKTRSEWMGARPDGWRTSPEWSGLGLDDRSTSPEWLGN